MRTMGTDEECDAVRRLVRQVDQVEMAGQQLWRRALLRISRGRFGRHRAGIVLETKLTAPWRDIPCWERSGWRTRQAYLDDKDVFSVDYRTCFRCHLGWVEWPFTFPQYQRCGLASAGLAALRDEHPGLSWHTLGGHERPSRPFWDAVGANVAGQYRQRELCPHVSAG